MSTAAERIGTLFGLGRSPWAPGTVGSIGALLVAVLVPSEVYPLAIGGLAAAAALAGPAVADRMIAAGGGSDPDPQHFVLDEAAGMWIALLRFEKPEHWTVYAAAFVLFRALDIAKPWPIGRLERAHGGLGVMLDDLAAGAIALGLAVIGSALL